MASILFAAAIVFVAAFEILAQPNPLNEIKAIALRVVPDENGNYFLKKYIKEGGKNFRLTVGYVPSEHNIGIIISDGEKSIIIIYNEDDKTYIEGLVINRVVISSGPISEEEAWADARLVLRYFKAGVEI
jgi:hypothetical protein